MKSLVDKAKQILSDADSGSEECKHYNNGFIDGVKFTEEQLKNCNLQNVNGCALLKKILDNQQEVISSPIRFNGVSNEDIKRIFSEFGIEYKQPF